MENMQCKDMVYINTKKETRYKKYDLNEYEDSLTFNHPIDKFDNKNIIC